MISETDAILSLAKDFLTLPTKKAGGEGRGRETKFLQKGLRSNRRARNEQLLLAASEIISKLLAEPPPSQEVLDRAGELFDSIADVRLIRDQFGEAYEMCSTLAFLGWRHSNALGLEVQSQEWLRVSDVLVREPFVALKCIEAFFRLPSDEQTPERTRKFLNRPEDIFLSLASLRRDRNSDPYEVLRFATLIYATCRTSTTLAAGDREFFLGEAAWLAGNASRYLGIRREAAMWLETSLSHFTELPSGAPLVLKVRLLSCTFARDLHNVEPARRQARALAAQFQKWGMNHEVLLCTLLECLIDKETGNLASALAGLEQLVVVARECGELDCLAFGLLNLGELLVGEGQVERATELLVEAAQVAHGSPMSEATLLFVLAESHGQFGNCSEAIRSYEAGLAKLVESGAVASLAYYRVHFAEFLLHSNYVKEAHAQLTSALPVLASEKMLPEVVHARKLMSEILSREKFGGFESVREKPTLVD
ncbi:MAG: hypothetical protein ABJC07_12925 [Acidobacteriota bacterium]